MGEKTLRLLIDLTYDPEIMHGDDDVAIEWFNSILLGEDLQLGDFGDLGDMIGSVRVVEQGVDRIEELQAQRNFAQKQVVIAEAKLAKAVEALEGWINVYTHCTIEEGVCCCGDDMKNHTLAVDSNHMPLDHGAYIAGRLAAHTETTLAELKGEK